MQASSDLSDIAKHVPERMPFLKNLCRGQNNVGRLEVVAFQATRKERKR
jgi:hypothetical protein